jgi:hypothetical protein
MSWFKRSNQRKKSVNFEYRKGLIYYLKQLVFDLQDGMVHLFVWAETCLLKYGAM